MLIFTQAVTRVCNRLNKNSSDTSVTARIKNHINDLCQEKWNGFAWSFRWREYPLVLSAQVTSGTMTATNGSRTVTASGTPFDTSLHKGAWIRFTGDTLQAFYRVITVVSTSQITIEPAYQGTTGSGKAYQLCKTEYLLPTEVGDLGRVKVTYNGMPLNIENHMQTDGYYQPPISIGPPYSVAMYNQDQTYTTYTTGTVTGTSGTLTLTGSGTSWLTNLQPGDEIVINGDTNTYIVNSIDSDTQVTLYNFLGSSPSGATYTASRQFGKVLRVQPCPDNAYVCFVKGLRTYSPLVNNSDTNELLIRYPTAVIEGAIWREAGSSPDPREDSYFQRAEFLWQTAQGEDERILPETNYNPIWNARRNYR